MTRAVHGSSCSWPVNHSAGMSALDAGNSGSWKARLLEADHDDGALLSGMNAGNLDDGSGALVFEYGTRHDGPVTVHGALVPTDAQAWC